MRKKKVFVSPRVIQEVQIQLEKDLLGTSVRYDMTVRSMGQGVQVYEFSENEDATYFVDWE